MTYTWTERPGGYALAPALQTLCAEIAASPKYRVLTNLGEKGDVRHDTEGLQSDHNPWLIGTKGSKYPGIGYVRAVDLGGPLALLLELRDDINKLYSRKFPPLWPYGYTKGPDDKITTWFSTTCVLHVDSGDQGHLHVSVTHGGSHPVAGSADWEPQLDSTAPWGIDTAGEDDMAITPVEMNEIADLVVSKLLAKSVPDASVPAGEKPAAHPFAFWLTAGTRNSQKLVKALVPTEPTK